MDQCGSVHVQSRQSILPQVLTSMSPVSTWEVQTLTVTNKQYHRELLAASSPTAASCSNNNEWLNGCKALFASTTAWWENAKVNMASITKHMCLTSATWRQARTPFCWSRMWQSMRRRWWKRSWVQHGHLFQPGWIHDVWAYPAHVPGFSLCVGRSKRFDGLPLLLWVLLLVHCAPKWWWMLATTTGWRAFPKPCSLQALYFECIISRNSKV